MDGIVEVLESVLDRLISNGVKKPAKRKLSTTVELQLLKVKTVRSF